MSDLFGQGLACDSLIHLSGNTGSEAREGESFVLLENIHRLMALGPRLVCQMNRHRGTSAMIFKGG